MPFWCQGNLPPNHRTASGKGNSLDCRSTFSFRSSRDPHCSQSCRGSDSPGPLQRGWNSADDVGRRIFDRTSWIFESHLFCVGSSGGVNVTLITQSSSENSLTVGIAASDLDAGVAALQQDLASDITLNRIAPIRVDEALSIVALVGSGMERAIGVSGRAFKALADAEVNIRAIAQGSTERNISIVVDTSDVPEAVPCIAPFLTSRLMSAFRCFALGLAKWGVNSWHNG